MTFEEESALQEVYFRLWLRLGKAISVQGMAHDGWGFVLPVDVYESLTPDTAPELERRLKRAFEILETGE